MEVPRIKKGQYTWTEMFGKFVLPGKPFLLSSEFTEDWISRKEWVLKDGTPNIERLVEKYGKYHVPVVSCSQDDSLEMTLHKYIYDYLLPQNEEFYLKDWHFQKQCQASSVYQPPPFLTMDWINNEEWTEDYSNPTGGDYRFLYFGSKGTWTPFHSDVLSTHSWSANICGRKLWYLVPRGSQHHFRHFKEYIKDIRNRMELWEKAGVVTFTQEAGEIVFIPSNYYHQVHNLETTVSLNHNTINVSNVDLVWKDLQQRYKEIRYEIQDVEGIFDKQEMEHQIQLILNADARLTYAKFFSLLELVIASRSHRSTICYVCPRHYDLSLCLTDPQCLSRWSNVCLCQNSTCDRCSISLYSFDLSMAIQIASSVKDKIDYGKMAAGMSENEIQEIWSCVSSSAQIPSSFRGKNQVNTRNLTQLFTDVYRSGLLTPLYEASFLLSEEKSFLTQFLKGKLAKRYLDVDWKVSVVVGNCYIQKSLHPIAHISIERQNFEFDMDGIAQARLALAEALLATEKYSND